VHDCLAVSFVIWAAYNLVIVAIAAALVVYVAPMAAGSGIPEIKCYLNGLKIPHVLRLNTLFVKIIGVALAVAAGMALGKEGPMIHAGAIVAAGISQGKSTTFPILTLPYFDAFRNDLEKRDFVSAGVAAGIAAAFGAPIGGVLLSLEEGASFYYQALIWRIFFCAMTATFTLNILLSGIKGKHWGALSDPGLFNLGKFDYMPYGLMELPIFMLMGILAGIFGALFVRLNEKINIFRLQYVTSKPLKLLDVFAVAFLTVSLSFFLIFVSPDCLPIETVPEATSPLQFFCPDHQYSAMGSLLFNTPENAIKNLYHVSNDCYNLLTLSIFFVAYQFLTTITSGLALPSGLFIPSMLIGAAWGRFVGTLIQLIYPNHSWVQVGVEGERKTGTTKIIHSPANMR